MYFLGFTLSISQEDVLGPMELLSQPLPVLSGVAKEELLSSTLDARLAVH